MGYFGPYFMILVQPTSKVVFNALKSVTIPVLISYILLSDDVAPGILKMVHQVRLKMFSLKMVDYSMSLLSLST